MKSTDHTWFAATAPGLRLAHRTALPSTLAPQCQFLLDVQPVHPLMIHLPAFALQQDLETAVPA